MKQAVYAKAFSGAVFPDPLLLVSQWAARNRILQTETSAEPGPWRNERTPYLTEVMDSLSPFDPVQYVVVMKATQLGFTEGGVNLVGYIIECSPAPILYVMDTDGQARKLSNTKMKSMLSSTKSIQHKVASRKSRDASSSMLEREFSGGMLTITGANSSSGLSSISVRFLIMDEVDRYPLDVNGEGEPTKIAKARTDAFYNRKIYELSTPAELETSRIAKSYERSDKREYYIVCPHCNGLQTLKWPQMKIEYNTDYQLTGEPLYECEHCGCLIEERHKTWMMAHESGAKWIPARKSDIRGYKINSLYSPLGMLSWRQVAQEFLDARLEQKRGNIQPMKTWQTTRLAEPWSNEDAVKSRSVDTVLALRDDRPRGVVPEAADTLIMGCDTQADGFYYTVRAFQAGRERNSWLVREGYVETFDGLSEVANEAYYDAKGRRFVVSVAFIDSGGGKAKGAENSRTAEVYDFCRINRLFRPIKGASSATAPLKHTKLMYYPNGKPMHGGLILTNVDTGYFKDLLSGKLQVAAGDAGAFMLHAETTEDYALQLTAEYKDDKGAWQCRSGKANHYWDCEVYALAAAEFKGLPYKTAEPETQTKPPQKIQPSGWMSRGRR